jgi:hypothetical protein
MIKKLAMLAGVIAVNASIIPAQAVTQESTFSGSVPGICSVGTAVNATTDFTLSADNTTLDATTNGFSFVSNGDAALQLQAVNVTASPTGASLNWNAQLLSSTGPVLPGAASAAAQSAVSAAQTRSANDLLQMQLTVTNQNAGEVLPAGTYTAVVTTDCIAS